MGIALLIEGCNRYGSMASSESIRFQFVAGSHCCDFLFPVEGALVTPASGHEAGRGGRRSCGGGGISTDAAFADLPGADETVDVVDLSSLPRELVIIRVGVEVSTETAHLSLHLGRD